MGIVADIGQGPVCLDTSIFIYFLEEHPLYSGFVSDIFQAIDEEKLCAITSTITLLETLVIPLRCGNLALANQYEKILCESKGVNIVACDRALVSQAAYLRATFQVKTPDALQIATAQLSHCSAFVTNDRRLPVIPGLNIIQLSDYTKER